jgi:hypothetical protein
MQMLDEILELTASVESAIEEGDWLAAGDFDRRRQELLRTLLGGRNAAELDSDTRDALKQVLARNQASVARLAGERGELIGTRQRLRRGAVAVRAYSDAGGVHTGD